MSDPVVAHSDRWSVPADSDAGGGGVKHFQICGSIRDCGEGKKNRPNISDIVREKIRENMEFVFLLVFWFPVSGKLSSPRLTA